MRLERRFPKMPHAGLLLGENKTAKITDELLNARPDGDEIKIRAQVVDLGFDKTLLHSGVGIKPVGAVREHRC